MFCWLRDCWLIIGIVIIHIFMAKSPLIKFFYCLSEECCVCWFVAMWIEKKSKIDAGGASVLEEAYKGKDVFVGGGMNCLRTLRKRKGKKDETLKLTLDSNLPEEHKQQISKTEHLTHEKIKVGKDKFKKYWKWFIEYW